MPIVLRNIEKDFATPDGGQLQVLRGIDAEIEDEEFVVLIGASGCGKSTLLNIVAGLTEPTAGGVLLDGKSVTGPGRDRGMVFQQDAILMWRSVRRNVEYGLELRGVSKSERREIVDEHLRLVGLERFADFFPKDLSGGMRKRVQIAAVFANNPEVLLMDEPFGSLDYVTKVTLQQELLRIWTQERKTTLFVTHDIEEATFLADRIFVLRSGLIENVIDVPFGRPRTVEMRTDPKFREILAELWKELALDQEAVLGAA